MPNAALSQFAQGGEREYRFLQQEIDRCAQNGHSYVFRGCRLLPGCTPEAVDVGFWRDSGGYVMFLAQDVRYQGDNPAGRRLFQTGRQGFGTFPELRGFLQTLGAGAPASGPWTAPRPAPQRPPQRLTEPEKVVPPRPAPLVPDYPRLRRELGRVVLGQDEAVETVAFKLYAHIGKRRPARPLSLILHGPTGVGKSELGKHVHDALNRCSGKNEWKLVWTELNTFTEPHSAYRLTGAPPGYVGYDDKPIFEAVNDCPRTVFMFDELEKAHPEVVKTFMSVLDEGRCAARKEKAGRGRELDFRQCIFLFTTNADLSGAASPGRMGFLPPPEDPQDATGAGPAGDLGGLPDLAGRIFAADERGRRALTANGCLREIAGRFGGFVAFHSLDGMARVEIAAKQIAALGEEYGLHLVHVAPETVQDVMDAMADEIFSVRSQASVVEGLLTPVFLQQAGPLAGRLVTLDGPLGRLRLSPWTGAASAS